MGVLTALSVSFLALKLGGVSDIGWGLIMLPAGLQGVVNFAKVYFSHRRMQKYLEQIQNQSEGGKEE